MRKVKNIVCAWAICLAIIASSCNLVNPAEPIPAYISIDTMMLTTNLVTEGSASHKITDVWVYVDQQPVGVYEMPAKIPVLYSGSHLISVRGGVLLNGINATHLGYPNYRFVDVQAELKSGEVTKLEGITTSYVEGATFKINEDFEGIIPFTASNGSPVGMTSGNDAVQAFEGSYGVIKADTGMYSFEVKSNALTLPNDGTNIYLEMNYRNSYPFSVVLQAEDAFGTVTKNNIITLNIKETWNKIYIELRPTMMITPNATKFNIVFANQRSEASTKEEFFFDNVKVVYK